MTTEQAQCLLGVPPDAGLKQIVSAHRRLISTVHPDRCSGPEATRLAREATVARDVLLAPAEARSQTPPPVSPVFVDDVVLRHVRAIVDRVGALLAAVDLYRIFRSDLGACGIAPHDARMCSARVLDDDFLADGAARGYWRLYGDGVCPVGWVRPPRPEPASRHRYRAPEGAGARPAADRAAARAVGVVEAHLPLWVQAAVRWAAAVAAASMFWLGAVGCTGVVAGAFAYGELVLAALAVPVVFVCAYAGAWIMGRFGVAGTALRRPAVFVPALFLSVAFFFLLVA